MTTALVPNRFLFDFEIPLRYRSAMPRIDGALSDWRDAERLPDFGAIDGRQAFAQVWACWSEGGIAIAVRVDGKLRPAADYPRMPR